VNQLYFGDNLDVLRSSIKGESVDLIYLDPPFNSSATYNVLFASPKGHQSHAQIEAFEDTWHWGPQAEKEFSEILSQPNTQVAEVMRALRQFLGENDMMAYLTMMANRLLELHRVLKPTGTLYLHCDPTASHYLKIVLDAVFGVTLFQAEIIWQRTATHNDAQRWPWLSDTILSYTKTGTFTWHPLYRPQSDEDIEKRYRHTDPDGRRFRLGPMDAPAGGGMSAINKKTGKPNGWYVWKGYQPPEKGWRYSPETMADLDKKGLIYYPEDMTKRLARRLYLDESKGALMGNIWTDITPLQASSAERLGYPTQKPLALLERVILASSSESDIVLDPFCGCGTAVHAAQKLGREWIGIDITHLAISLIEKRLRDAFPAIKFDVHGTPKDLGGASNLALRDKYQFQWWACSLVNAQPYQGKKKGADGGIDGLIYFQDDKGPSKKIIVSVKGGENVGVAMVKDLIATVAHQKAEIGLFVTLTEPTRPLLTEAVAAGFYTSPANGAKFQKIQVLTIDDLLSGKAQAAYPRLDAGAATFRKAQLEHGQDTQGDWLSGPPSGRKAKKKSAK
jgi:DNA modification methylase